MFNVIDSIGIRAVDVGGACRDVLVQVGGACSVSVDGRSIESVFNENGISVRRCLQ